FIGIVDHAEMRPVGPGRWHTKGRPERGPDFLGHSPRIPALRAKHPAKRNRLPLLRVKPSLFIARLQLLAFVELEFVVAFAAREAAVVVSIAAVSAAEPRADMVIDDPIINERTFPILGAPC